MANEHAEHDMSLKAEESDGSNWSCIANLGTAKKVTGDPVAKWAIDNAIALIRSQQAELARLELRGDKWIDYAERLKAHIEKIDPEFERHITEIQDAADAAAKPFPVPLTSPTPPE